MTDNNIQKMVKNINITNLGKYLGRMSTSGSTVKNNKRSMGIGPIGQARQQGCFWEHSMTFYDILPLLPNDKLS